MSIKKFSTAAVSLGAAMAFGCGTVAQAAPISSNNEHAAIARYDHSNSANKISSSDAARYADEMSQAYVNIFRYVIVKNASGNYVVNSAAAAKYVPTAPMTALSRIASSLNAQASGTTGVHRGTSTGVANPAFNTGEFGKCVVTGVLGFSPFQIDYNMLGQYIRQHAWSMVANILKKYAEEEIEHKAGNVVLEQIIKSTPAGFAAWLGVYSVGCAAKQWF